MPKKRGSFRKKKTPRKPAPKRKAPSQKPARAPEAAERAPKKPEKIEVTPQLRRIWFRIRNTYNLSFDAFSNALSLLNDKEANMLYDLAITALYKDNVAEIMREHPELKEMVRTDDDRICMHDIYENLSWRLRRREPQPRDREVISRFRTATKGVLKA